MPLQKVLGENGYYLLGAVCFALMAYVLYRVASNKRKNESSI